MSPTRRAFLVLLLSTAALVHLSALPPSAPTLAIVVHHSNPVDEMTFSELRRIFMLDTQTWPHGRKITVVLRETGQSERADAIRIICGLSEADYDKHVFFRTFQGSVNIVPRLLQSASAVLRFVYNAPGAIGSVAADQVDASVKVLRIDGALPGDPRYPLRRPAHGTTEEER